MNWWDNYISSFNFTITRMSVKWHSIRQQKLSKKNLRLLHLTDMNICHADNWRSFFSCVYNLTIEHLATCTRLQIMRSNHLDYDIVFLPLCSRLQPIKDITVAIWQISDVITVPQTAPWSRALDVSLQLPFCLYFFRHDFCLLSVEECVMGILTRCYWWIRSRWL